MTTSVQPLPVFAWPVTFASDSITVEVVTGGGTTTEVCAIANGSPWGWKTGASYGAATDSLAYYVGQALLAHTLITAVAAEYVDGQTERVPRYSVACTAAPALSISITAVTGIAKEALGIVALPHALVAGGGVFTFTSAGACDGVFSGANDLTEKDYGRLFVASQRFAALAKSSRSNVWAGSNNQTSRRYRLLRICRRYLDRRYAAQSLDATQAGTLTADTYGTIDRLIEAAVNGSNILVSEDATTSQECVLDFGDDPTVDDFVSQASLGGRRYDATFTLWEV